VAKRRPVEPLEIKVYILGMISNNGDERITTPNGLTIGGISIIVKVNQQETFGTW
jgi:hypothetical protein